jgi:hypothetical protein
VPDRANDTDSAIDLTFVSPCLATGMAWKLLPLMGSDHRPVLTSIPRPKQEVRRNDKRKNTFRYKMKGKSIITQCRREVKERNRQAGVDSRSEKPKWLNTRVEEAWTAKMKASKDYSKAKKD